MTAYLSFCIYQQYGYCGLGKEAHVDSTCVSHGTLSVCVCVCVLFSMLDIIL